MGSIWSWFHPTLHPVSPDCSRTRQWNIPGTSIYACLIWMRHGFSVPWDWKEDCVGCLAQHAWSHNRVFSLISRSKPGVHRWHGSNREICCSPVSANISTQPCERGEEAPVCFSKPQNRKRATHIACPRTARETGSVGRVHMGTISCSWAPTSFTRCMGLGESEWQFSVDPALDYMSRGS